MIGRLRGVPLDRLYFWLIGPLLLALVYIVPPFQAPDELSHFFRAIQISHGEIRPLVATDYHRAAAGGAVETSAWMMKAQYCPKAMWFCSSPKRPSLNGLLRGAPFADQRRVTAFSNTVIYIPTAHASPAVGIRLARGAGLSSLAWLYAGRLCNALLALAATVIALRLLRRHRSGLLVFVLATLPMTLSVLPSLSADCAVISFAFVLLACCVRIVDGTARAWMLPLLLVAVLFAATAKLAYLPLALIPPACALGSALPRKWLASTLLVAGLAIAVTVAWSSTMRAYAFPISPDPLVDIPGQLAFIRQHPVGSATNILVSIILGLPRAAVQVVGWKLSAFTVPLPLPIVASALLVLALGLLLAGERERSPWLRAYVALVALGCVCACFLFLYIQDTAVGASRVHGFQGRYLLPVLPFLAFAMPRTNEASRQRAAFMRDVAVGGSLLNALAVTAFLALRTWE